MQNEAGQQLVAGPNGTHYLAQPLRQDSAIMPLPINFGALREIKEAGQALRQLPGFSGMEGTGIPEAFKLLRTQLSQRMRSSGLNSIAVTSARPDEGKTFTATNLALSIAAEFDKTVLLIDADLPRASLQRSFGLENGIGLSDMLLDSLPLSQTIISPGIERLYFLPAGRPVSSSAEILAMEATRRLMAGLKLGNPDLYIVVDLPPILVTADALSFLPNVDATLMVIEEGKLKRQDAERAAEMLAPFNLLGLVVNKSRMRDVPYYYGRRVS